MKAKHRWVSLLIAFAGLCVTPVAYGQQSVADLKYVEMGHYSWMKLATIVPKVTDRVILAVGTVEPHGATAIGSDAYIPINLGQLAARKCNALVAPAINHGASGLSISAHPGAIRIRPEVLEEYIVDVLEGLAATGFRNIFIINGHGGNTEAIALSMARVFEHHKGKIRMMVSDWWTIPKGQELSAKAFNLPKHDIGAHGNLEEAALNQAINPDFFDWETFNALGPAKVANVFDEGYRLLPAPFTMGYFGYNPTKDIEAAKRFTQMIADYYAESFNKAVEAWDFLENRDKGVK